jgi:serine protease Do
LGAITAFVVLGTLTIAAAAVTNLAAGNAAQGTPWYAEAPSAASSAMTVSQANVGAKTENPAYYAKSLSKAFHNAASAVLPAVVTITNSPKAAEQSEEEAAPKGNSEDVPFGFKGTPFEDLFKHHPEFFGEMPFGRMPGMPHHGVVSFGSGVIVDPSGVVLTNNHVVAGGGQIMVRLQDGREFKAIDIKTDPKADLAVLRLKGASDLPAAQLGDSSQVEVGDWVVALGQPFGLPGTVTAGIISAKGRGGIGITGGRGDFLQTDAAINPGNSGGPLVNLDGEIIGINTAINSTNGGYQGVGFAIPSNLAKWVGGQLMTAGKVHRAYLGVSLQPVNQSLAEQFKVKVNQGVLVAQVFPDTPAAKAGLKAGDVILEFGGKPISSPHELQGLVEMAKPGGTDPLTILRDGQRMTLAVKAAEMPADYGIVGATSPQGSDNEKAETSRFEKLGVEVEDMTPALAEQFGVKAEHGGVVITGVRSGSPAELAGLAKGNVIIEANHKPVKSVADFRKALGNKSLEKGILLLVRSEEGSRFIVIRVESE